MTTEKIGWQFKPKYQWFWNIVYEINLIPHKLGFHNIKKQNDVTKNYKYYCDICGELWY